MKIKLRYQLLTRSVLTRPYLFANSTIEHMDPPYLSQLLYVFNYYNILALNQIIMIIKLCLCGVEAHLLIY